MSSPILHNLFDLPAHNPSFHAIKASGVFRGELLDFCVPVNSHFPPSALIQEIRENLLEILQYYPDEAAVQAGQISELAGLDADTIIPANGSTEIITLLCQEAAGPVVTCIPTFGRWTDLPLENNLPLYTIQRRRENAFRLEVAQIVRRVRDFRARTLVISKPNNPTGASMSLSEVQVLAGQLQDLHTIIIDESFIDFSNRESASGLAAQTNNVLVVKSMGKSLGWHGVRLGYAVAEPERVRHLRKRLPYWNINGRAAHVLKRVVAFKAEYEASFRKVAGDRDYMMRRLAALTPLTVYPSAANFVFVELPEMVSGRQLRDHLLERHGIIVRETSNKLGSTEQYLRLAVQPQAAVNTLVAALAEELSCMRDMPSLRTSPRA